MQKYKITASKSQKKYIFVLTTENEKLAKERIHKEGYSILSIEPFNENIITNKKFIFKGEKNGKITTGTVIGNDIFKIYLKLVDGVGYNLLELYPEKDKNKDNFYKKNILKDLKEQYKFYTVNNKDYKNKKQETIKQGKNNINIDNFYLKKELEETYKLIDFVLEKVKSLLNNQKYNLSDTKKEKLQQLYNSLVKIKSSTNIAKLKMIGEAILLKIGKIELEFLEKHKDKESKKYLNETNVLLRKIGSNKKFIEGNKDLKKQIKKTYIEIEDFFKDIFKKKKKKTINDKTSYSFLKYKLFLGKYKQKLRENNYEIIKNIHCFIYPFGKLGDKKTLILLKRSVITQNIYLFKAKLKLKNYSYTKTLKGFYYIFDIILKFFNYIKNYLFFVVFFYSLLFLIFLNIKYYNLFPYLNINLNYNGIFYFIIFIFIYFAIYFSRGILSLIINFILLTYIINFLVINF